MKPLLEDDKYKEMEEKCKEFIAKDGWKCQVCYLRRACCENPGTDVSEHALHTSCTSSSAPCTSARGSGTGMIPPISSVVRTG